MNTPYTKMKGTYFQVFVKFETWEIVFSYSFLSHFSKRDFLLETRHSRIQNWEKARPYLSDNMR